MSLYRRLVLLSCLSWPLAGFSATALTNLVAEPFAKLEQDFGGSIGVYAMDTGSGATVSYRAEERFPLCSSFKGFLAAAVLARSQQQAGLLDTHPLRQKCAGSVVTHLGKISDNRHDGGGAVRGRRAIQ